MTLHEVICNCDKDKVMQSLIKSYPDQEDIIYRYSSMFDGLLYTTPIHPEKPFIIMLSPVYSGCEDVCGKDCSACNPLDLGEIEGYAIDGLDPAEPKIKYGIELTPWAEWLGYDIDTISVPELSLEDIVAHCLWEMTFVSFNESEIMEMVSSLEEIVLDIENDQANGRSSGISWEELKKQLDIEDEEERENEDD
jgi:hypothetical protein